MSEEDRAAELAHDEKKFLSWWREDTPTNRARLEENYVPQNRGPVTKIGFTP